MSKYDIKKSPQLPSDEEINKHKNFDKVLNKAAMYDYKKATKPVYKNTKVLSIVAVIVAVSLIFLFETQEENAEHEKKTKEVDTIQKNNAVPLQDTTQAPATKPASSTQQSSGTTAAVPVTEQVQTTDNSTTVNTATGITVVKALADFPGGDEALNKFLLANIKYPYNAVETPYSGKVEVELKIEATGEIGNVTIYHSPNAAISNEIQRVIKKMPKWKPAVKNDQTVASTVTVYFPFKYIGEPQQ